MVEAYALLGGLDALRHLLLLGDFRRLGAGHLVELAADASFIVWMHASEMGELPLDDFMRHTPHGLRHVEIEPRLLSGIEQIEQRRDLLVVVVAVAVM